MRIHVPAVTDEIKLIKKSMHGRLRSEERKKKKNAISDREIKRITGKLRSVLDSMVNQKKNTYDMESLNTDIDTVISSPRP